MIGIFINMSLIFLFIRFFFFETWSQYGKIPWLSYCGFFLYTCILIWIQLQYSLGIIMQRCSLGGEDIAVGKLLLYILFPNIFIFWFMFIILKIFPGWKAPFSNTFGYLLASTMGISGTFTKLLTDLTKKEDNISNEVKASIKQVTGNKSLMINQFTIDNFSETFKSFVANGIFTVLDKGGKLDFSGNSVTSFKSSIDRIEHNEAIKDLFKAVTAKDLVSEHIWYILAGCLVITILQNTMGELNCDLLKVPKNDFT